MRRHERADIAAEPRDLLHQLRAEESVGTLGHHENRLQPLVKFAVHQRHLELEFEIRHRAQPTNHRARAATLCVFHQQPIEGLHLYTRQRLQRAHRHPPPLSQREKRALRVVARHRHDNAVEQLRRTFHHVQMPVGEGVEAAGVDDSSHKFTFPIRRPARKLFPERKQRLLRFLRRVSHTPTAHFFANRGKLAAATACPWRLSFSSGV